MLLKDVADASAEVAASPARNAKVALVAALLERCAQAEAATVAAYLSGTLPQRRVGVGWRGLTDLPDPSPQASLTIAETDAALSLLTTTTGVGSATARKATLEHLLGRATAAEQDFLRGLLLGGLRQGALDGVMLAAIAMAAGVPQSSVRRAAMLAGFVGPVAQAALTGGAQALAALTLEVGRPARPMLAGSAPNVAAAFPGLTTGAPAATGTGTGTAASHPEVSADTIGDLRIVERKVDGIRLQAHKRGADVRLFTRSLEEITDRLPEVVELVRTVRADTAILDGETVALDAAGRPHPFQITGARTASRHDPDVLRVATPLTTAFFDVLNVDGIDLLDEPLTTRLERLGAIVPSGAAIERLSTRSAQKAQAFFDAQIASGHEGILVKDPTSTYAAGRRGAGWLKVKPRHTLDLVVLAVEWGSGRRRGMLSNIHLGARGTDGDFVMLGKTFKGMTDTMLTWQTARFLELETHREGHTVYVRPEVVAEIAFDGFQRSTRYPGGLTLRFARVLRYRDDKAAHDADTFAAVTRMWDDFRRSEGEAGPDEGEAGPDDGEAGPDDGEAGPDGGGGGRP